MNVHCALQKEIIPEGGGQLNYVAPSGKAPSELPANLWDKPGRSRRESGPQAVADNGLVIGTLLPGKAQ